MGCNTSKTILYSVIEEEEKNNNQTKSSDPIAIQKPSLYPGTRCYINPHIESWEKEMDNYKGKTVIREILNLMNSQPNLEALGYRKPINDKEFEKHFTYFKYSEMKNFAENFSKNLVINSLCPANYFSVDGVFQFLGLFSRNCFEWVISDLACQMNKITSVTFYATLGDEAFEYIADQTKLLTICVSPDNVANLISYIKKYNITTIKNVILFDYTLYLGEKIIYELKEIGLNVFLFSNLIKSNNLHDKIKLNLSEADTILTLCYTSGTTGIPKGVKISQNNLISGILSVFKSAQIEYNTLERLLIYLPLAHIFERGNILATLVYGSKTGFISGDVRTSLQEDLEILKPTIVIAVPRVLQLFRNKIIDTINNLPDGCSKNTALKALRVKREAFQSDHSNVSHYLYDNLVFNKIREKFGGKIKYFITGSAALTEEIATDIKIIFSCPIIEGYGLTECCAGLTVTYAQDTSNESVGGPLLNCKIKLVDVPEMNYHSKTKLDGELSPTGEICLWGPTVFQGYFQNQLATNEAIDEEGWFHTGDIGRILPHNLSLKIIDRKKEIFKLAQGEYLAPSKLESVYSKSRFVMNICIYGNSTKNSIVAIIVPNKDAVLEFLKKKGKISNTDNLHIESFYTDSELVAEIKIDLDLLAKQSNFNSLEKISKFYLSPNEFTIQNGCLTSTLKIARNVIFKEFEKEIESMYRNDK